ncbi:hypothetical protein [Lacinutrix salivirga]
MKLTAENIKKNYPILIIKFSIISIFIIVLIQASIRTTIYWEDNIEADFGIRNLLKVIRRTSFYRPVIILLIPLIGIFLNKKIGWILIQSYFYFLISNLIFSAKYIDLTDNTLVIINLIGFSLLLLIIFLMNKKKIWNLIYGIEKTELISKNVVTSIIGMSITIILAFIKANGI